MKIILSMLCLIFAFGCAPKIYVIERTTLLEEEAGGQWPDLESRWKKANVNKSPKAMKTNESSERQKKLTQTLESDAL